MSDGRKKTVAFCTLGCKVNQYDTDTMQTLLEDSGYSTVDFSGVADVYVINTCSVTHVSDRKSRQMISKAHHKNPDAVIVVCGCYAQVAHDEVQALEGVDIVLGTSDRSRIVSVLNELFNGTEKSGDCYYDKSDFEDLCSSTTEKTRAILKIQEGCNRFCTYCIIPYARGRLKSRSLESIRSELLRLSDNGFNEIVFTGIHLMSYGIDLHNDTGIIEAIKQADGIDGIKRIRLGSLDPCFMTDDVIEYISGNEKVCRQFHLSMQSGSDTVLSRMNRRYTTTEFHQVVDKLRTHMPDCAITTDIIAGFPGETDAEHAETIRFMETISFSRVHAFPYSPRKGTKAAAMPNQVSQSVKEQRVKEIISVGNSCKQEYAKRFVGRVLPVLIEERAGESDLLRGYTDTYINTTVINEGDCDIIGRIVDVKILSACDGELHGAVV